MLGQIRRLLERRRRGGADGIGPQPEQALIGHLERDVKAVCAVLADSADLVVRYFATGAEGRRAVVLYFEGLVDKGTIQTHILAPIIQFTNLANGVGSWDENLKHLTDHLMTTAVSAAATLSLEKTANTVADALMMGRAAVMIDGQREALIAEVPGGDQRGVTENITERTVRGPRDSFVENFPTNIALIRRRARSPGLKVEILRVGQRTKTRVALCYYTNIAKPELINEVKRRINLISVDEVMSNGQIEQSIEDNPWSPFPQIAATERPDKTTAAIVSGRVAILTEGAPFALLAPSVFSHFIYSPDDYYERWLVASVIRLTRYLNVIFTTMLPAVYIAIVSFSPGLLPTPLMLSITGARVNAPFPAFFEALLMEFVLEVLQEAGVRLPSMVGQTVTFVGGLVIGQAAVQAGLVSPIMVIIVALTAITSFTIPTYSMNLALRLLRIPFMICAVTMGIYGLGIGIIAVLTHLSGLKSFGVAYVSPLSPLALRDWKDSLIRVPAEKLTMRPAYLDTQDQQSRDMDGGEQNG